MVTGRSVLRSAAASPVDRRSDALGSLSSMCKELGQLDEARSALAEALEMALERPEHAFNMGVIELKLGNWISQSRFLNRRLR